MYETTEMRTVLANLLAEEMRKNPDVVIVDADLARAHNTLPMKQEFPDRALDVGIAECNMASVAAGLASYGFKPFIYSFAPFASRRICDQIAISIVYAEQNVKIVGSDPCLAAEMNGATHMAVEDVGVLRSLPGMVIFEPVDGDQLAAAFPAIMAYEGPMFIRLFRKVPPATIFADPDYKFDLFKADMLKEGADVSLFATGIEVKEALEAAELLAAEGISAEVINVHTIKPVDKETVLASVKKTGCAVSCENHNIIGGLGSAISEVLISEYPVPMEFIGMRDHFSEVGKAPYLQKLYKMDAASIAEAAKAVIQKKNK
ncbi:MAG: transketolase family protein [Clostridiales bacterium]|nr:transketolase family protein [Clostridiales bacterium]